MAMDLGLAGKVALVTGSTAGIGYATARRLALEGASVVINGLTDARVHAAIASLLKEVASANVRGVAADVSTAEGCDALISAFPKVDVLVNNAGIFESKAFENITDGDWLRFFEMNVLSGVRLSRHHVMQMMASGWGRIVFVSSESAIRIPVETIHYDTTKTALLAVARGLAERARGTGVTVNSVLPGPTASERVKAYLRELAKQRDISEAAAVAEFFETTSPTSLIRRFATPDEVANMIAYVASAAASATTGAALRVDGGVVSSIL
jgi:NAD(P)-dependent dehydrogenase (short-subunit alcohol dehydrogenase family)